MDDILQSGYHESPPGFNKVKWFVREVTKYEINMTFQFKKFKKNSIMTKEDEKHYRKKNICRFCNCNIIVTQKQSKFIQFAFQNFSNYDCHLFFFKKLVDKKRQIKFKTKPEAKEECISVTYGCIKLLDNYRFLSSSLEEIFKNLDADHFKLLKNWCLDHREILNKKLAYPYENFIKNEGYQKLVYNFKNEEFFN